MLKVMFGVLTGLLTVSCVPYIAVQWDVIKASAESALVAAATVLLPLLLLAGLYVLESARYKYKYRQAWLELMEKYQEIQQGNLESIENYDMLICKTIPTLRWTYEYKLDVDFFKQCCSYASAKIVHHKKKLKERVNGIGTCLIISEQKKTEELLMTVSKALAILLNLMRRIAAEKRILRFIL